MSELAEIPTVNRPGTRALRSLAQDFARFAGLRLWLLLALMLAGSIAEGFGLLMIVPLAAIALGQASSLPAWVASPFERFAADQALLVAAALFLTAMALRSLLLIWRESLRARLQWTYQASLQLRAAATLAEAGWNKASRIGHAGMQSLLLNDVPRALLCLSYLLDFAVAAIFLSVQLVLAAFLSPALAAFALVGLAPAFLLLRGFTRRLVRSGEALTRGAEDSTGAGIRLQSGLKSALAQGSSAQFLDEYGSSLERLAAEHVRYAGDLAVSRQLSAFATALAAVVLLVAGARMLGLPFPILAATLVLFARMAVPAVTLLQSAQQAIATAPSFLAIERRLGPLKLFSHQAEPAGRTRPLDWERVDLDGVGYRHESGGGVGPINLELKRGEWLGLRGPSGAGKTTLADIIVCLHQPQEGSLRVDGAPLEGERLERWRAGIAYVGQEGLVFADSVAANLAAGQGEINEERMWQTLEAVGLAARVRSFAGGLHHPLGGSGSALSGGERQRLLIARAMLRRPNLIILDEATAALDPAAEAGVLEALRRLDSRPAAILVAHRDSTLGHCQTVLDVQHRLSGRAE